MALKIKEAMKMQIESRVLVSYDEYCPFECKHCYTYGINRETLRTVDEIVDGISDIPFDVVYVSQKNDNFAIPERGIQLCEKLFERYECNIFAITRNVLDDSYIARISDLASKMERHGKKFFFAVSIPALKSSSVTECVSKVPSPTERLDFMKRLYDKKVTTIALIRPLYPDTIVPLNEIYEIIDRCSKNVHCIVSGGLGVNDDVLMRLGMDATDFSYVDKPYLQGAIDCDIKFIDVTLEMQALIEKCQSVGIPFFEHSMPALNYLSRTA